MTDEQNFQFIEALMKCSRMLEEGSRTTLLERLDLQEKIRRDANARTEVVNIVAECDKRKKLKALVSWLKSLEGGSSPEMKAVQEVFDQIEASAQAAQVVIIEPVDSAKPPQPTVGPGRQPAVRPAKVGATTAERATEATVPVPPGASVSGDLPTNPTVEEALGFYEGPAFALVIGISNYEHGRDPNRVLAPEEFTNLTCPAKDAKDFAAFLKQYAPIKYTVQLLLDEEARLTRIKDEFEKLRKQCRDSNTKNPLVIIYFSGHGMLDEKDRHYLIPYEARRDRLFATAFWNKDFSNCLDELETRRLVVFLDACHSGAIGAGGVKHGVSDRYDAKKDISPRMGYTIASCGPGQISHEGKQGKQNSIFTEHLLELLNCNTNEIGEEEVDLFDLYSALKTKVLSQQPDQEPTAQIASRTGIILTINQHVKEQTRQQKMKFWQTLDEVVNNNPRLVEGPIVLAKLRRYAEAGSIDQKYRPIYRLFESYFKTGIAADNEVLIECCEELIDEYKQALKKGKDQFEGGSVQTAPGPVSVARTVAAQSALDSVSVARTLIPGSGPDQKPRRQLSLRAREEILAEINLEAAYFTEGTILKETLSQPLSEADFLAKVSELENSRKEDIQFLNILRRTTDRFTKCWNAPESDADKPKKLSDFRMEKR